MSLSFPLIWFNFDSHRFKFVQAWLKIFWLLLYSWKQPVLAILCFIDWCHMIRSYSQLESAIICFVFSNVIVIILSPNFFYTLCSHGLSNHSSMTLCNDPKRFQLIKGLAGPRFCLPIAGPLIFNFINSNKSPLISKPKS